MPGWLSSCVEATKRSQVVFYNFLRMKRSKLEILVMIVQHVDKRSEYAMRQ